MGFIDLLYGPKKIFLPHFPRLAGIDLASISGFPPAVIAIAREVSAKIRDDQERERAVADVCMGLFKGQIRPVFSISP